MMEIVQLINICGEAESHECIHNSLTSAGSKVFEGVISKAASLKYFFIFFKLFLFNRSRMYI